MEGVDLIASWREDPEKFVTEALKVDTITTQQKCGLTAVRNLVISKLKKSLNMKLNPDEDFLAKKAGISIMSGHGTGKDALASWLILWFLCCFKNSLIPCTAPTGHQLKDILWREINKWLRQSEIKDWIIWQAEKVYFAEAGGKEWFAVGRTANPRSTSEEQAETLAGFHEDYMMVMIDEASGIPAPVFRPLEATLTGFVNFIFMIFNPTRSTGFAIDSQAKDRKQWVCLQWNAEESERVSTDSTERIAKKYGINSNAYRIRVKGLPPIAEEHILIPWDWVMDAVDRNDLLISDYDLEICGIDVGAGSDPSIFLRRCGPIVYPIDQIDTADSEVLTGWCMRKIADYEPVCVMVDTIGIGWAIEGNLRSRTSANIIGINVAESAYDDKRFHRLRDELWWSVREKFEKRIISIPNDDELIGELTTIRWDEPNGKIMVESKKDLKKRNIESPNKADALCLTEYYQPEIIRKMKRNSGKRRNREGLSWKTV